MWMKAARKWTIPSFFKARDMGCLLALACVTPHAFTNAVNKRSRWAFSFSAGVEATVVAVLLISELNCNKCQSDKWQFFTVKLTANRTTMTMAMQHKETFAHRCFTNKADAILSKFESHECHNALETVPSSLTFPTRLTSHWQDRLHGVHVSSLPTLLCRHKSVDMHNVVMEHVIETQLFVPCDCSVLDLASCSLGCTVFPDPELGTPLQFLDWITCEIIPSSNTSHSEAGSKIHRSSKPWLLQGDRSSDSLLALQLMGSNNWACFWLTWLTVHSIWCCSWKTQTTTVVNKSLHIMAPPCGNCLSFVIFVADASLLTSSSTAALKTNKLLLSMRWKNNETKRVQWQKRKENKWIRRRMNRFFPPVPYTL